LKNTSLERKINMKKLYRKQQGRVLTGLCNGIADYFELDVSLIRLGWIVFCCLGGSGVLAYIIASIVVPSDDTTVIPK
jgi:phage shock protein C